MRALMACTAMALALAATGGARADVKWTGESGFRLESRVTIAAAPDKVFTALGQIGSWWDSAHTYSGKAANMTLQMKPGGCFCEALQGGGVKHGEVVLVMSERMLRLDAPLGPLQDGGVSAALTFTLKPAPGGGTEVIQAYNVGGARPDIVKAAPAVDGVVGGQLARLKAFVETGTAP